MSGMNVDAFRAIANADPHLSRVEIQGDRLVNGQQSFLGRTIGIIFRSRANDGVGVLAAASAGWTIGNIFRSRANANKQVHDKFGDALMREFGHAGALALSLREGGANKKLSSAQITRMIDIAQSEYAKHPEYVNSRKTVDPVSRIEQFQNLHRLDHLQPGDILIKKIFPGEGGAVEKAITRAQRLFERPETFTSGGTRHEFPLMGTSSSEHAAIAVGGHVLAEANSRGVRQNPTNANTNYIVYRPKDAASAAEIARIATGLANTPEPQKIKYSLWGVIKSSFRSTINSSQTNHRVESGLRYLNGETRNNFLSERMFCSEFAAIAVDMASTRMHGKLAFGVNPRSVSPMVLEDILNQRPDLFDLAGQYTRPEGGPNEAPEANGGADVAEADDVAEAEDAQVIGKPGENRKSPLAERMAAGDAIYPEDRGSFIDS